MTTSRKFNIEWQDRNITTWMNEGMGESIEGDASLIYNKVANIRTLNRPEDLIATFYGGGFYKRHGEWQKADVYEPGLGWKIKVFPYIYKNGFQVPDAMLEFETNGYVATQSRILGAYATQTIDNLWVNILNNGFDTNFPVYDGKPLFSTTHPLKGTGGVFANTPQTGSDLDANSLMEGMQYFLNMKSDDGMEFSMTPRFLIVHTSKFYQTQLMLGTPTALGQANPAIPSPLSVTPAGGLVVLTSAKLTDPNAWFLLADRSEIAGMGHGLDLWFTPAGRPRVKTYRLEDPDGYKYVGAFRAGTAVTKIRGVYGNPGTT
jgi:hypothetical protein